MKRIFLAGLLGGIAMFAWTSLAHLVLPLGKTGVQEIPNEAPVLAAMQASLGQNSGLYFFPGLGLGPNATPEQDRAAMKDYQKKLDANPSGILIYRPAASVKALDPRQLGIEFLTEFLEALLAAFLLAQTRLGYLGRVGFVLVAGILAAMTTNVPYWNWFGFPTNYTEAYMTIEIVGYLCAGLVAAA
ncbi:MAG TPA: hypothetical protein VLT85_06055, partial [Terriglobales bacterium]|nr:hypothetical protein [Terriglobales bacterium]